LEYFARHFIVIIEFFYIDYTTNLLKILFPKNKKALQQKAKGLEIVSSPYWKALELLRGILQ